MVVAAFVGQTAQAATYYWDNNGTSPGFGTAGGVWGTNPFWNTDATGGAGGSFNLNTTTTDAVNFGNGGTGLAAGSIGTTGATQGFLSMTFASGSGAVTLSSGGTLTHGSAGSGTTQGSVITVDNATNTIDAVIAGASGVLRKSGTGTLRLTGANTFTGADVNGVSIAVTAGVLEFTSIANSGTNSALGNSGSIGLRGGTLRYTGSGHTSNRRLQAGLTPTIDASGTGALVLNDTVGTGGDGIAGNRTLTLTGTSTALNTYGIVIANSGGTWSVVKEGTGTWVLSAVNTYTGGTTINDGTLRMDLSARSGSVNLGAISVGANGTLDLYNTNTAVDNVLVTGTTNITGTGKITKTGLGYIGLWNDTDTIRDFAGLVDVQAGTLGSNVNGWQNSAGKMNLNIESGAFFDIRTQDVRINQLTGDGTVYSSINSNKTLYVGSDGGSSTFDGAILNGSGTIALTKVGGGTITLTGNSNFSGSNSSTGFSTVDIQAGVLSVDNVALNGMSSALGGGSGAIALRGGTFQYTGTGGTIQRRIELSTTGGTIDASGSGALVWDNTGGLGGAGVAGSRTLTLTGTSNALNDMKMVLANPSGHQVSLLKDGIGTWVLSSTNTYTGGTTINDGTLLVNNTSGSGTGSGAIVVNANGTLGGTGNIANTTNAINLFGTVSPGIGVGTLSADSFNWQSGGTYAWDVSSFSGTAGIDWDLLNLTGGTLTFIGGGPFNVDIDASAIGLMAPGDYLFEIIRADNIVGFPSSLANFNLTANGPMDTEWSIFQQGNSVFLQATVAPEPSTLLMFAIVGFGCMLGGRIVNRRRKSITRKP